MIFGLRQKSIGVRIRSRSWLAETWIGRCQQGWWCWLQDPICGALLSLALRPLLPIIRDLRSLHLRSLQLHSLQLRKFLFMRIIVFFGPFRVRE
jgi:hypothetical protein